MLKSALILLLVAGAAGLTSAAPGGHHTAALWGSHQPSGGPGAARALASTGTGAISSSSSEATLQDAEDDEQLLSSAAVDAFLEQLLQVLQGTGADTAPWEAVRSHGDQLVPYLRAKRLQSLLQLLRACMLEENLGGAILDLHSFASQLAPADFVAWAARRDGRPLSRPAGKDLIGRPSSNEGQATVDPALRLRATQAAGARRASTRTRRGHRHATRRRSSRHLLSPVGAV